MVLSNTQHIESIAEECHDLFETNGEWKSSIQESINETVTTIKSKENDIQLKYEKVLEMRNSLLEKEKELKSRIEVITKISKTSRLQFGVNYFIRFRSSIPLKFYLKIFFFS